jgi:SET domain-containing protein
MSTKVRITRTLKKTTLQLTLYFSTYYRFDDYTLTLNLFALREIQPGEELTYSCKYPFQ